MLSGTSEVNEKVTSVQNKPSTRPALAAIVVIPDTYDTVRRTMSHLKAQTAAKRIEIILVVPSQQQLELDESELTCFHSWHVVEVGKVTSIGHGFVAGIRQSHAPIVALTEDHSFPDADWAKLLIAAHRQPWAAVGPSMRNGNPDNIVSQADFYQAYGEWSQPISSGSVRHLPGHNSSYKRDVLLAYGNKLGDLMQAESVLHRHLRAQGYKLRLESATCTSHLNFISWSSWIPLRYYTGRQFAATWSREWSWLHRLLFTVAFPLIPCVRLWRVQKQVRRSQNLGFLIRLLPAMLVGFLVESIGHMMGYLKGIGNSVEKVSKYEFHRV